MKFSKTFFVFLAIGLLSAAVYVPHRAYAAENMGMPQGNENMKDGKPHMMDGKQNMKDGKPHMMDGKQNMKDGKPHMMDSNGKKDNGMMQKPSDQSQAGEEPSSAHDAHK